VAHREAQQRYWIGNRLHHVPDHDALEAFTQIDR
jgi:hypothetical protein